MPPPGSEVLIAPWPSSTPSYVRRTGTVPPWPGGSRNGRWPSVSASPGLLWPVSTGPDAGSAVPWLWGSAVATGRSLVPALSPDKSARGHGYVKGGERSVTIRYGRVAKALQGAGARSGTGMRNLRGGTGRGFHDRSVPGRSVITCRTGGRRGGCSVADGDCDNTARTAGRNDGED